MCFQCIFFIKFVGLNLCFCKRLNILRRIILDEKKTIVSKGSGLLNSLCSTSSSIEDDFDIL